MAEKTHQPDYLLIFIIAVITIFGLIMLSSASAVIAFQKFGDSGYFVKRQIIYGLSLGIFGFIFAYKVRYSWWKKMSFIFLLFTIILLLAIFIPGLGFTSGGARRWIQLGGVLIQPTELAKLTFLLYLSSWLEKRDRKSLQDPAFGLTPFLIMLGVITLLIMLQPDLGTMSVIVLIALTVFFVGGAPLKHLLYIILGGSLLFGLLIKIAPYRAARFTVFLNPSLDPQGIGYHINQALLAIGSGGIWGLGLGHSRQKYNYLPEVTGDSIFAVIAEELGFIFSLILVILFLVLMYRGFKIAKRAPDQFGRLLAAGITVWLTLQAFVNIAAMAGLLPLTGIPLPLVSYGSSAIAVALTAVGILVNISKHTKEA